VTTTVIGAGWHLMLATPELIPDDDAEPGRRIDCRATAA
jgi:hypothetical protein